MQNGESLNKSKSRISGLGFIHKARRHIYKFYIKRNIFMFEATCA